MHLGSRPKREALQDPAGASGAMPQSQDDGYFRQSSASSSETCIRNIHETRTANSTVGAHAASSNNSFSRIVLSIAGPSGAGLYPPNLRRA